MEGRGVSSTIPVYLASESPYFLSIYHGIGQRIYKIEALGSVLSLNINFV